MVNRLKIFITISILAAAIVASYYVKNDSLTKPQINKAVTTEELSENQSVISPDGKKQLSLTVNKNADVKTFSFYIDGIRIFKQSDTGGDLYFLPRNAFSPDNKFVFIGKKNNGISNFYLLKANVDRDDDNNDPVEIRILFEAKYPDYKITDVTGWGSLRLIIVNTDKAEGGQGPSFWFDVTSNSFIRLSSRFN